MTFSPPSYYQSGDMDVDRRTTEQDEFNRAIQRRQGLIEGLLNIVFGDPQLIQIKEFVFEKTAGGTESARFRHDFGEIVTEYQLLNVQGTSGAGITVEYPGRLSQSIPETGVDDEEFITLQFLDRGVYIIRFVFSSRLAGAIPDLEGPS